MTANIASSGGMKKNRSFRFEQFFEFVDSRKGVQNSNQASFCPKNRLFIERKA